MTDAREIIALAIEPFVHHADDVTSVVINTLTAAGYRILGPDEVDPMTLEKAADAAEEQAEWVPLKAGDMRAAILAIGRKA